MNYLIINTAIKTEILLHSGKDYYFSMPQKTMASTQLLPKLDNVLNQAKLSIDQIDVFGCVTGPGSFTGIRIGVSTIRALAYALNKPVAAVTYFDVLTYNSVMPICALVDGSNGVCYLKNYTDANDGSLPICIRNQDIFKYAICNNFIADHKFDAALSDCNLISDDCAALKGAFENSIAKNGTIEYNQLIPLYLRRSQPERGEGEV